MPKCLFKNDRNGRPIALMTAKPSQTQIEWACDRMSTRRDPVDPADVELTELEAKEGSPFRFMLSKSNLEDMPE